VKRIYWAYYGDDLDKITLVRCKTSVQAAAAMDQFRRNFKYHGISNCAADETLARESARAKGMTVTAVINY
jgi:hypothetical protein